MVKNRTIRIYFLVLIVSFITFFLSAILHNFLSVLFGKEESVFFVIAVFISPIGILVGTVGTLFFGAKCLLSKRRKVKRKF